MSSLHPKRSDVLTEMLR
jgi:hypothetical protein